MFMDSNKNHFLFFLRCATRRELPLSLSPVNTQHLPPWSRRLTGLRLGLRDSELGPYLVRNLLARPRFQIPLLLLETREGIMHPSFTSACFATFPSALLARHHRIYSHAGSNKIDACNAATAATSRAHTSPHLVPALPQDPSPALQAWSGARTAVTCEVCAGM